MRIIKDIASLLLISILFLATTNVSTAEAGPKNKWEISCGVDKGAIKKSGKTWTFKTSSNHCVGGTFNQRAEIISEKFSPTSKGAYKFQTFFSINSGRSERFDVFQLHDGRNGCAPPLKVEIQKSGQMTFDSELKAAPLLDAKSKCFKNNTMSRSGSKVRIKQNGTEYKLDVVLNFDGSGGFDVFVFVDDVEQIRGTYFLPQGKGYGKPKHFWLKHGVYSKDVFPYQMSSRNLTIKKVRLKN